MRFLPDPSAPLSGSAGREPAGDVQPAHDGRDMTADRRGADPRPPGDRVIVQPLREQPQHLMLHRCRPVPRRRRPLRDQRGRAFPQHLEVLPQRGDDHRSPEYACWRSNCG